MQAVILAGGLGSRLRPLTEHTPKVMISVNGKPFLLYQLELLKSQGIKDIVLCIGYLGKQVRDFFGNGERFGIRIRYSEEKGELMGTGGALKQAQDLLDEHFFVMNGDTYLPIDYRELERTFLSYGKKALMLVYDNHEDTGLMNNVELDGNLMVTKHDKENANPNLEYIEAGVLSLRLGALDFIPERCSISLEKGLYSTLIGQRELVAYVTEQRFYDIGTPNQKKIFEEFLKNKTA